MRKARFKLLDPTALDAVARDINLAVPWILMSGYAYYCLDKPLLSDGCYDDLCKRAGAEWDRITHRHKSLLIGPDPESEVKMCSSFNLGEDAYPLIVKSATRRLLGI